MTTTRALGARSLVSAALVVAVVDTAYLSWRFVALQEGWVEPHTGLCSWSDFVDCDAVLMTAQARAFWVPNAILGWGFFSGAALWWFLAPRVAPTASRLALRIAAAWFAVATLLTLYFWWLLLHLPFVCPFCPWNHVWTYIALGGALWGLRQPSDGPASPADRRRLAALFAACATWFMAWQLGWAALSGALGA